MFEENINVKIMRLASRIIKGLITQVGTDNPTIVYLQNDFQDTFTCTRATTGLYNLVMGNHFLENRTWLQIGGQLENRATATAEIERRLDNTLRVYTFDSDVAADGILNNTSFEVECFCDCLEETE